MSRSFLLFLFLLFSIRVSAPNLQIISIIESEPIEVYQKLINAMILVESSGDSMAYNALEDAYGILQIRPVRLNDYNKRTGKRYNMKDCYRPQISKEVFLYYANLMPYPDYETIAKRWNGSGKMTITYWKKVREVLEKT
jgi:hypothetical protein